jgi:hypothetical protein
VTAAIVTIVVVAIVITVAGHDGHLFLAGTAIHNFAPLKTRGF